MRTLILSDLHLGSVSARTCCAARAARGARFRLSPDVERVVLLGDVLELGTGRCAKRWRPRGPSSGARRARCEGQGAGDRRGQPRPRARRTVAGAAARSSEPAPLEPEQLLEPADVSPAIERLASWAAPAPCASPTPACGCAPDVYATHGHYLDCHLTVPTLERLSVARDEPRARRPAGTFACADDYEASARRCSHGATPSRGTRGQGAP